MVVSLIIPTKDRPFHLEQCLSSIAKLNFTFVEIVVVDGSTSRFPRERTKYFVSRVGGKYLREPREGSSIARNTGIKGSHGSIIAFTDDDCIVDRDWLRYLTRRFNDPSVMCVTGRTKPFSTDIMSRLFELFASFDRGSAERRFGPESISVNLNLLKLLKRISFKRYGNLTPAPWGVGYSNNFACRKEMFQKVGVFDENLGRGTPATGGEDVDLFYQILKAGYRILYEPKAIVYHRHRRRRKDLLKIMYSNGWANLCFLSKYILKDPYLQLCYIGQIVNLVLTSVKHLAKFDRDGFSLVTTELCGWLGL